MIVRVASFRKKPLLAPVVERGGVKACLAASRPASTPSPPVPTLALLLKTVVGLGVLVVINGGEPLSFPGVAFGSISVVVTPMWKSAFKGLCPLDEDLEVASKGRLFIGHGARVVDDKEDVGFFVVGLFECVCLICARRAFGGERGGQW